MKSRPECNSLLEKDSFDRGGDGVHPAVLREDSFGKAPISKAASRNEQAPISKISFEYRGKLGVIQLRERGFYDRIVPVARNVKIPVP